MKGRCGRESVEGKESKVQVVVQVFVQPGGLFGGDGIYVLQAAGSWECGGEFYR